MAPITPYDATAFHTSGKLTIYEWLLRTQIGRPVQVEFLVGTNNMVTRSGILLAVGANFILINEAETDDILACDFTTSSLFGFTTNLSLYKGGAEHSHRLL